MCGIVGTIGTLPSPAADPLGNALFALAPRGPDEGARTEASLGIHAVRLGVRRLALVDPVGGAQPVHRSSGAVLVWNGEVYNHHELRRHLKEHGEVFRTGGDGEVLCALLDREGIDGLKRVEGSYAFAFLAGPEGPLYLGRDTMGVRPLVYARASEGLVFSSTLDGLLATGALSAEPDLDAIADVLRDGVIPTERTAVLGARRVAPGEVIVVDANLTCTSRAIPEPQVEADDSALSVLDALRLAVRDRLRVDRPAGLLLSGGVDSGLIAAIARETHAVPAFTLTYPGLGSADEGRRARATAARLGIEHVVVPCPADPTAWVLGTSRAFDEPFADSSAVPTWGIAREASRRVRTLLSGTGGDEMFGGYRRYWLVGAGPWLRHVPSFIRTQIGRVLERRAPGSARVLRASTDPQGLYRGLLRLHPVHEIRSIVGPLLAQVAEPEPRNGPTTAAEAMHDDLVRYLPDDLLVKEDRALMAHGVEGRHPFLDGRVRRAASRIEHRGSPGRGRQKQVLRAYVQEFVDPDLARTPKHGFAFPVDDFYRGPLRDLAEDALLGRTARERGFVSPAGTRRLFRSHLSGVRNAGAVLHALVMLELWARRVLDRQPHGVQ